jgi:hypothetical protein
VAKKNKWTQPSNPPPPLFTGKKERDLVKKINDEIIERVVGQTVMYYPISLEHTNFHSLYGEAINKTFLPPIRVHALVQWQGIASTNTNIGIDKVSSIDVFFHKRRLVEDQDLYVREGDFVLYGQFLYEILSLNEPKEIFGQVDHKMEILAKCTRARRGVFDAT